MKLLLIAAVVVAGLFLFSMAKGHIDSPAAASQSSLTPAAACHDLDMAHGGSVNVPGVTALRNVASHMAANPEARKFAATARSVASDESSRSFRHTLRLGPDFAALMNKCGQFVPSGKAV